MSGKKPTKTKRAKKSPVVKRNKNLIYQYWDGEVRPSALAGVENMKAYAERIGADYVFETNVNFAKSHGVRPHFGAFKPVYDDAIVNNYDAVMFADTDVFAVDGLTTSVFDEFYEGGVDIGICTEPLQPAIRYDSSVVTQVTQNTEEAFARMVLNSWGGTLPRDDRGRLKVYNSGMVLYSKAGLKAAKRAFIPFSDYVTACSMNGLRGVYPLDQNYLHAMMFSKGMKVQEISNGWNTLLTQDTYDKPKIYDSRTPDSKFVHVQFRSADNYDADMHYKFVNRPVDEWGHGFTEGSTKS